ncbi:MAG: tRNA epoxyqueuosine(34) reductase QueG, partial [Acidobacteriota bacterium]|nr:tRNA epoxyqueuosine(34) reductase QueG [Acidobacteriota bacterium]
MIKLSDIWPSVERVARDNGVVRLGASDLADTHGVLFADWLDRGHHATMHYLARTRDVRRDPGVRFPWAKSAIVILVPYSSTRPAAPAAALSHHVARYALGDDYHDVLDRILREVESVVAPHGKTRRYVDTGPLSDRALAAQAGLGWIAKNAMLINEKIGSYTFIGTLLTSLENDLVPDAVAGRCGTCTRCLDACPTNAILANRTVASEHCISYATIEHRGELPDLPLAGNAFGCDICQEVCPWN